MDEKHIASTYNRPEGERVIDAPGVIIDLPTYIRQIRSEDAWLKSDRNSITVYKTDDLRIVLGGLHKDAELPAHKAEGIMSLQVLEGRLELNTDELTDTLRPLQIIAIHKDCNYRFVATEETIYLLTMSCVEEK